MIVKLRKKLKKSRQKGFFDGEMQATVRYRKAMNLMFQEHEKQIQELVKSQRLEIRVIEKEYILKQARIEKKMRRLDSLITEWEENIYQVKEISSQAREVLARIKQAMYQDRKNLANVLDDDKTIEMLQLNLNNLVNKQNTIPQNSTLI
ncbi:MAG: hypothetical protein OEV78_01045 [Spirochaetia bacterium]|nr:hypothetical protein [Spirochaetia bacterium]